MACATDVSRATVCCILLDLIYIIFMTKVSHVYYSQIVT